ncbi:MAG TPA: hypothetical protein VHL98_10855 [Microvirga sp.]|jgi:transcriptional regulator NrdR family protein|nr:hypothetical protein [Microvirga sp.]
MICPRCGSDTRVIETREVEGKPVIRRRRRCAEGHRFDTYESREKPTHLVERPPGYQAALMRKRRAQDRERDQRDRLREIARQEHKQTGEPLEQVYARFGVA